MATDKNEVSFMDVGYLRERGLREDNVLEYFSRSPFWSQEEGTEFVLANVLNPGPTFVIRQQRRRSGPSAQVVAVFYIMQGTVYRCPSLHDLVKARLEKCAFFLNRGLDELRDNCQRNTSIPKQKPSYTDDRPDLALKAMIGHLAEDEQDQERIQSILEAATAGVEAKKDALLRPPPPSFWNRPPS